ncbi:hypothetical protein PC118_g20804 [Phytophthora cactorum]|uniref:Uncharacterized protein n=1 Tax=Phytophthora cactorum TaxID=29920 RepID=A0A8T1F1P6_9STRA|nr:hypothetical protein PC111_g19281 [Phytophthora cactorum]KAG2963597.1 hypothetical protein PC118_g20804 [Phytophthora cactorum]KAG2980758.1 hypothetical protein PC119_g21202 [Phytophthora cactorum]KAG2995389.1 hypothetical protein PC120_g21775 [Phytophthora cactorum]KAG3063754.1 hypothetical protein PC122_g18755 [Phytophthora cactorum]
MERSEFAVKFCAIEFQVTESGDKLQTLLEQKEKLLEATLTAKQSTENCLVCTVLNAKKDEVDKSSLGAIFLVEVVKIEQ